MVNTLKAEVVSALRRELQRITDTYIDGREHEQIALIQDLNSKYPHQISLIQEAISGDSDTYQFTCYQYAFDLVDPPTSINRIVINFNREIYVSSEYVSWMVNHELNTVSNDAKWDGDIVLYQRENTFKHAGILRNGLVYSKWGLGHLWSHDILELPENFGCPTGFFRRNSSSTSVESFITFAKDRAGEDAINNLLNRRVGLRF